MNVQWYGLAWPIFYVVRCNLSVDRDYNRWELSLGLFGFGVVVWTKRKQDRYTKPMITEESGE
jgi:hypothetical protein